MLHQIVLCIGNALNTATFRGGASGFAMEALVRSSLALRPLHAG
jgi:hypothetical protein